jgi:limonene-1,2-epoxide hydrolase
MSPTDFVERYFKLTNFIAATGSRESIVEQARLVSPDIVYHNIPLRIIRGAEEFRAFRAGFAGLESMRIDMVHIAQDGEYLLMERDEEWRIRGVTVSDRIMGIMRVVDDLVVEWTDYQAHFQSWRNSGQMPKEFWARWEVPAGDRGRT